MSEPSDEELVRRFRTGDAGAAATLFERHRGLLRGTARRVIRGVVRRRLDASDVVQDAYLAAFGALDDFEDRGPGSFERWLRGILRNKANDQVRRHLGTAKRGGRREVSRGDDAPAPEEVFPGPTASAVARGQEDHDALRAAMAQLPEAYRTVLDCVHRNGMTLAEIGVSTGRSANAVCKVYGRALRELTRLLQEGSR